MKKLFLSVLAIAMMSSAAVYAENGKKPSKKAKKKAKTECCKKAVCPKSSCDKTTCPITMPGCGSK